MNKISIKDAGLPGVMTFENRADYKKRMGVDPPPYDKNLPIQIWMDTIDRRTQRTGIINPTANPYDGVTYNLVIRETVANVGEPLVYGSPLLETTLIPYSVARRVNLPDDQSGIRVDDMIFPIRDLQPGERVNGDPFGVWIETQNG